MELTKSWKKMTAIVLAVLLALTFLPAGIPGGDDYVHAAPVADILVRDLTVEYVDAPQGIDVEKPRFGWKQKSNLVGAIQTAYEIVVKKTADYGGTVVWDSGKVNSSASIGVKYAGTALSPETDYEFTVTVYDNFGNNAFASSSFSTGVSTWDGAKWISPGETNYAVSMLRTEKAIANKAVKTAKLYMTSLGIYRAYINGELVQGEIETAFDPGWVNYIDYIKYQTYDVTDYISGDKVALSAELGRGWYKSSISANGYRSILTGVPDGGTLPLALYGKLVIEYADGDKAVIVTDESWKFNNSGPVYNHDFYSNGNFNPAATTDPNNLVDGVAWGGEKYDARNEIPNWNKVGFDDSAWTASRIGTYNGRIESGNDAARAYYNLERLQIPKNDAYIFDDINTSVAGLDFGEVVKKTNVKFNDTGAVDMNEDNTADSVTLMPGERLIVNLGQNIAGVLETSMEAAEGTSVVFSHVEMLNDGMRNPTSSGGGSQAAGGLPADQQDRFKARGTIYTANLRGEKTAVYKFGADHDITYRPDFTFFGFQYVQITTTHPVTIKKIVGVPITSAMKQTGDIETNIQPLNQLFSNVLWSQMDNFLSIPTDCPQRNERCGWTGDIQLFAETGVFNFDAAAFLQNYVEIADDQAARFSDRYTAIMPAQQSYGTGVNSGWSDVGVLLPWVLYQQTGDLSIITKSYDQMDKYMDAIGANGAGYATNNYGDWVALQACSLQYLNCVYRAYDAQVMAKMAAAIGDEAKVEKYEKIFADTKAFYMNNYVSKGTDNDGLVDGDIKSAYAINATTGVGTDQAGRGSNNGGTYVNNSQTAISWALKLGFYRDEAHKQHILSRLLESIKNEDSSIRPGYAEDTLAVGFLGLNTILPALSGAGATDTVFKLLLQDEFPSWLFSVKSGATSIWERWNSYSIDNSFLQPSMNSFNHFSFGACVEWMYEEMAGIGKDEGNPGFKHFVLQPTLDPNGGITDVDASYDSYYGVIESAWEAASDNSLKNYAATVPANTEATLYLPVSDAKSVKSVNGVAYLGQQVHNGLETAAFSVKPGSFAFAVDGGNITVSLADGYVTAASANRDALVALWNLVSPSVSGSTYPELSANQAKYVTGAWAAFNTALGNAMGIMYNPSATQDQVDAAYVALATTYAGLKYKAGATTLSGLKLITDKLSTEKEADYTPATWQGFASALAAAKAALASPDSYTDEDINALTGALLAAQTKLVAKADTLLLKEAVAEAERLLAESDKYTPKSVKALQDALNAAVPVLADAGATQAQVDEAALELLDAISITLEKADKSELLWLTEFLSEVTNNNSYTAASWKTFQDALAAAKALVADENATASEADKARDALVDGYMGLVRKANFATLQNAVTRANDILAHSDDYVADTIANLPTVLADASALLLDDEATQSSVDSAATALAKELVKVRLKPDVRPLSAILRQAQSMNLSSYTADSVAVLNAALEAAKEVIAKADTVTEEAVEEAVLNVTTALASLVSVQNPAQGVETANVSTPDGLITEGDGGVIAPDGKSVLPKSKVLKITAKAKAKVVVKWAKAPAAAKVTGYQIQYRVKGTSKWKTRTVSVKSTSLTIKNLKKNKKYQIRVRVYRSISGKTSYGAWSAVKTGVKVK